MPLTPADLVVEDGTGLANANSYASLTFANDYHRLRDNVIWINAADHHKVGALIRATDYVDRRWRFVGSLFNATQALAWPRLEAFDADGNDQSEKVPGVVQEATAEYALRALSTASVLDSTALLLPDPARDDGFVVGKREKVGPIEEETRFSERIRRPIKSYPNADRLLIASGLVLPVGGSVRA
jgi:hypothetical protein